MFGHAPHRPVAVIQERSVATRKPGAPTFKDTYEQLRKIGQGGQGKLWIVKRKSDRRVLVRKEQKHYGMHGDVPAEMYIFEKVLTPHPRIIEFDHANYIRNERTLVLYFEHCEGGDLSQYMPRAGDKGVTEPFLKECFTQLADAVAFLHYGYDRGARHPDQPPRGWCRVVHRDIKPENCFVRRKISSGSPIPQIVLGDFGLATLKAETSGCGTDMWIGPEIPFMSKEGDVWGVGAVVHALAHGRGPVPRPPADWAAEEWYRSPLARQPKRLPRGYEDWLDRCMMACLERSLERRISSLGLVKELSRGRCR